MLWATIRNFVTLAALMPQLRLNRQVTFPNLNMSSSNDACEALPQGQKQVLSTARSAVEGEANPATVDMEAYRQKHALWKRVWRHSLTQMMLLSIQAFCGPAMDDAIAGKQSSFRYSQWLVYWCMLQVWVAVVWPHRRRLIPRTVTLLRTQPIKTVQSAHKVCVQHI